MKQLESFRIGFQVIVLDFQNFLDILPQKQKDRITEPEILQKLFLNLHRGIGMQLIFGQGMKRPRESVKFLSI